MTREQALEAALREVLRTFDENDPAFDERERVTADLEALVFRSAHEALALPAGVDYDRKPVADALEAQRAFDAKWGERPRAGGGIITPEKT